MAAKRVFTESEVEDLVSKVLARAASNKDNKDTKQTADLKDALRKQDAAILKGELTREKKDRIRSVVHNPEATSEDKIEALGGESALTPFQLLRIHGDHTNRHEVPRAPALLEQPQRDDLRFQVLGKNPNTNELTRYYNMGEILKGVVTEGPLSPDGPTIEVKGEQYLGDLVRILRYFIYGTRGYTHGPPAGAFEIAKVLRDGGIKRSRFPPGVRPLLGGKGKTPLPRRASAEAALPAQAEQAAHSSSSEDDADAEQSGRGIDPLSEAMDKAERGDHGGAWTKLYTARQMKAPHSLLKKAEDYCAQLRDGQH